MIIRLPTGQDLSSVIVTLTEPEQFTLLLFFIAYSPNLPSKTISKNRNISEEAQLQSGLGVFLEKDMLPPGLWRVETDGACLKQTIPCSTQWKTSCSGGVAWKSGEQVRVAQTEG